jgi:tetratricopeptide (TPR) repeat protein
MNANKINIEFRNREILYQLFLTLIVVYLYSFSCHYPIYKGWDDVTYMLYNPYLGFSFSNILYWFTHPCVGCYLPITMLSYMFDYSLWGLNSFGYHLQNIIWHIVATIAIYKCFRLFNIKSWIAFFLCLIFAVHPQRIESVVWLSERKDVLCAAFYFLCIYFYIKNYEKRFSITAFIFFILSMLSKSMAVSLPVILLIYEFYRYGKERRKVIDYRLAVEGRDQWFEDEKQRAGAGKQEKNTKPIRLIDLIRLPGRSLGTKPGGLTRLWPYFLILFIFIPVTILAQGGTAHSHNQIFSFQRLYIIFYNICRYFLQTLLPIELNPVYPAIHPYSSIFELLLFYTAVIVILSILFYKNRKLFIYCILPLVSVYIVSLLPVVGLVKLGSINHADRYSYISSVFIWFSIGLILTKILYEEKLELKYRKTFFLRKKFIFIILAVYASILFFINYQYQKKWKNMHRLFSYASNCVPVNSVALIGLGDIELNKGHYGEVLIIAEKLKGKDNLMASFFEASVLFHLDRKSTVELLLKIKPLLKSSRNFKDNHFRYISVLGMLTVYYDSIGNTRKAAEYNDEILSLPKLDTFMRFSCMGLREYYLKNYKKANRFFERALKLKPKDKIVLKYIDLCDRAGAEH